jgi:hypothetical protein
MIISHKVKDTILLPIVYAVIFVSCLFFSCIFNIIYTIGAQLSLLPALSQDLIISLIPHAISTMFLFSLFLTVFFVLIRLQKKPGIRMASFLIILACSLFLFLAGYPYIDENFPGADLPRIGRAVEPKDLGSPQKLFRFKEATLFFEGSEGALLNNLVIINNTPNTPDISTYQTGRISVAENSVVLTAASPGQTRYQFSPQAPLSSLFLADGAATFLISHYEKLVATFSSLYNSSRFDFYLFSLAMLFLICTAGVFMRLSRWPVFNIFLYICVLLLVFLFNNFIVYTMIPEIKKFMGGSFFLNILPSVILLIIATAFFLMDFMLLPKKYFGRKRLSA